MMDDLSSNEITDHPKQQINDLIAKIQTLSNFTCFDMSIFEQIRKEFVLLPSYLVKEASQPATTTIMNITINFLQRIDYQSENSEKNKFLGNLLSLLRLMGFKASKMDPLFIDQMFSTFSAFIRICNVHLLLLVLHVFNNILENNESEPIRQKFLKYFVPSFGLRIKLLDQKFATGMNLAETNFLLQTFEFLLKLTENTYSEIQNDVTQLLSTLYHFITINLDTCSDVQNILLIQTKIIKLFITYSQFRFPNQYFNVEKATLYQLSILSHADSSYFYTIRESLYNIICILRSNPQNTNIFSQLLDKLTLFCQFSRYNHNIVDPYAIFIFTVYEGALKLQLITDQHRVHLFFYMMNILHYQNVPSFIRHNEFAQLQQHISIKGNILFLYNYSFDVDFIKSIKNLSKYFNTKNDIDSLLCAYEKTSNIGKSVLKIFKILASNLQIIFEKYRSNISSLCEVTSKYNICHTKLLITTLCDAMLFAVSFHHLLNYLSTIIPEISKTTSVNNFYEIERKMITVSNQADNNEKTYSALLNELVNIFSIMPMNFVCNIWDIFIKQLFNQKNCIKFEKSFISTFSQKSITLIPMIDSYFSFVIPQFQTYENIEYLFSVTLFVFQALNEAEIDKQISTSSQQLLHNHALRLIYIMKEDYVISIKHSSDALNLISVVIKFIDRFEEGSQFASNLINNNNFLRDICQSFQCISIHPSNILKFFDFCSSVSESSIILPYVIEILITSLDKCPNQAIPLLNKAAKKSKKAVYQHSLSPLLFQTSTYLLNRMEKSANKKILLKFLKHSTQCNESIINKIPDDIVNLKKIIFTNDKDDLEFSLILSIFVDKLKKTLMQSPKNEMLYEIVNETVISIFATEDLTFDNRKIILSLLAFILTFYEDESELVSSCLRKIISQSEGNFVVYSHIFASLCSSFKEPPHNLLSLIIQVVNSIHDFESLVNEILIISYFHLLPSKSVLETMIQTLIQNVQSDLIDPISLALLGYEYLSESSFSFAIKNEYKDDNLTTFSELGYLPKQQIEVIIFIRELLGKSSLSLSRIFNLIPSLSVFPQIILFEFISECECNDEVVSFFDRYIDDNTSMDGAQQARLVGLTMRAFPKIVSLKSDKILKLLSHLESSYLMNSSSSSNSSSISSSPPSTAAVNSCSPSSSLSSLPQFFTSSSMMTFSTGSIERQQEGNIILLLNVLLSTNPDLVTNVANYFNSVNRYLMSNNLFYRHQARIAVKKFNEINNNEIDFMINIAHKEYMHRVNFPEDIYDSTFIDFSACYEYLMVFFPIYHSQIFSTIIKYLERIENSFFSNREDSQNYLQKKPEKHKINQDIFIKSLLSLFSFFSNGMVIKILSSEGYMKKLLPFIVFVYCTFVFQRDRIFDEYILKMLEQAPKEFIEYINTSSTHQRCLEFFIIFLENEKAFEIMKDHENEITLNLNSIYQKPNLSSYSSQNNLMHKDKLPNNYYLSITAILTLFGKDVEKVQQCLLNHINLFKCDIRLFEPFLFSKIMTNFASHWPNLFLLILFNIIEADSPLLLAHCRTIFNDNVDSFDEELFDNLPYNQHSDIVNEIFCNYIICQYISKKPTSLNHFIDLINNTQSVSVTASFYLFLKKKKIISDYNDNFYDSLNLYEKSDNDKTRLKVLLYWTNFNKTSDFNKMFLYLQSFVSSYPPSEIYDCLLKLKIPKDCELPKSFFEMIPFFYYHEAVYSALFTFLSQNCENVKHFPISLKQDILMNLEYSFESQNSRARELMSLFDAVFEMIRSKNDEMLIHRCKGYITKTIAVARVNSNASRTFLKMILQNAFKIIKLYRNEEEEEENNDENENDEKVGNRLFLDEILTFFNYMLENKRTAQFFPVIAYFLPEMTELLVINDDENNAEYLLSQIVDLDNLALWPSVMRALNIISEFDNIYERIVEFRSTSLVNHSLPIIWNSSKEKSPKQIDLTIDFCSSSPKSRVDILLQNICMVYMTRNIQNSISFYLLKRIYKSVDFILCNDTNEIEKSKEVIFKILKFGIKSDNEAFVNELFKLFDNKKIMKIYFERNDYPIEDEILSKLSNVALLNGCNLYMDKFPDYIRKVFANLNHNYYIKISEVFAQVFRSPPEKVIGLMINIGSKLKVKSLTQGNKKNKEIVHLAAQNSAEIKKEKKNQSKEKEKDKDDEKADLDNFEGYLEEEEEEYNEDEGKTKKSSKKNESQEQEEDIEFASLFNDENHFKFPKTGISIRTSFECLENLSYWNISKLKLSPNFSYSFYPKMPSYLLYSHFSLQDKAEESIVHYLDDPKLSLSQIDNIISKPNFDSFLNFITENINEPDVVRTELENILDTMQGMLDSRNFLDYLIIQSLKCPIEMLCRRSMSFPPHAFELKLSPTILPKYHNFYSKVRETFLTAFSNSNYISEMSTSSNENKALSNLKNKFKSIHEKHLFEERLSVANFSGEEMKFNTQERDIERIITAVFFSSLSNEPNEIIDATISTLERGLKLNPSNDVFLTILAAKYDEIDSEKFEGLLNLIKNIPFRWSPKFINLITKAGNVFKSLLSKIHRGLCISLVENGIDVPHDMKKLVNSYLGPLHNIINSEKGKQIKITTKAEKEILRILRKKNFTKKAIPSDIKQVLINYKENNISETETETETEKEEEEVKKVETEKVNNDSYSEIINDPSLSFFITSFLPSPPPPLVDDSNTAISMACYLKKNDDKFITVTILLNNGCSRNYILAPIEISQQYALFSSLISKILMADQQCYLQSQIIGSMMSAKLKGGFTLVNTNDAEPLYRTFLLKKLYLGAKQHIKIDEKEKTKKNVETQYETYNNELFYNFSGKESYIKWFYHFGSRYAAISVIQSFLDIPTPSPTEVFINVKTASPMLSSISTEYSSMNTRFSFVRMCGKMRKFCSRFMLNGPFRDGLISASTCFSVNQYKVSLFLESVLYETKKEPFTFLKRCACHSYHHSNSEIIQENTNYLIEKSYNDQKIFIIPWL